MKHFPISNSRIEAFDGCPYYFYRTYVDAPPKDYKSTYDPVAPLNLRVGQFCHRVMELYNKALIASKQETDFGVFEEIFNKEWDAHHFIPEVEYEEIHNMLYTFAERHTISTDYTYDAEVEIALDWELKPCGWNDKGIFVRAKIDRLDIKGTTAEITDYKTQFYVPSDTEIKRSMQGKIYPWALSVINPNLTRFVMIFNYMRWGVIRKYEVDLAGLATIERRLRTFSKKIDELKARGDESVWVARVGDRCGICSFPCPLVDSDSPPVKTKADAVLYGMQIQALGQRQAQLKNQLKQWAKLHGDVPIGTGVYKWSIAPVVSLPYGGVCDYCTEHGINAESVMSVDAKKIAMLPPEHYENIMKLNAKAGQVRNSFSYKAHRGTDEDE